MRNKIAAILLAVTMSGFLSGCKTPEQSQAAVLLFSIAAKDATYLGMSSDLKAHPEHRQAVVLARDSLKAFVAAGTLDSATLLAVLQQLPVGEFKGDRGAMIVGDIVILVDQFGKILKLKDNTQFQNFGIPIANAIVLGLTLALDQAQPQAQFMPNTWRPPVWVTDPDGLAVVRPSPIVTNLTDIAPGSVYYR